MSFKKRRHLVIVEAAAATDDAVGESGAGLDALGGVVDQRGFDVADLALLEAGQPVGDDFREHGQHALGQVDAGAALAGLAVQGAAGRGEVGHVRNVDPE